MVMTSSTCHTGNARLLKALFAHPARWPDEAAALIRSVIGHPTTTDCTFEGSEGAGLVVLRPG
jgi:hypothetical protein